MDRLVQATFGELLGALASSTLVSFALAIPVAAIVAVFRTQTTTGIAPDPSGSPYAGQRRALGAAALLVLIAVLVEQIVDGYAVNLHDVAAWWRYATPLIAAGVGIGAVLAMILARRVRATVPVLTGSRRSALTFGRGSVMSGAVSLGALAVVAVAAGLMSSPDQHGRYVYIEIPIPNTDIDPVRMWFFGWAYGLPVLAVLVVLAALTFASLHANALRPFMRPDTVAAERRARDLTAGGIAGLATAAALLALGGALRFISDARVTSLEIDGKAVYESVWGAFAIASVGGWIAPLLEIAGFVGLILAVGRAFNPLRSRVNVAEQAAA